MNLGEGAQFSPSYIFFFFSQNFQVCTVVSGKAHSWRKKGLRVENSRELLET